MHTYDNNVKAGVHLAAAEGKATFSQKLDGNYPIFRIETDSSGTVIKTGTEGSTAGTRNIHFKVGNEDALTLKEGVTLQGGAGLWSDDTAQVYIGKHDQY